MTKFSEDKTGGGGGGVEGLKIKKTVGPLIRWCMCVCVYVHVHIYGPILR